MAKRLAAGRSVIAVDLRNHGRSPHADGMDYPAMAGDVAALVAREAAGPVALVGHSMGGKLAMTLALTRPDLVAGLAILDIAPVTYDHPAFARYLDAMLAVDLAAHPSRGAVEAALAEVDPDPRIRAFLTTNLDVGPEGARWLPNLAALRAAMPAILGFPADLAASRYTGPTLFLLGSRSDYLPKALEPAARALFPAARFERLEGAGHWLHADAPEATIAALDAFLPRQG